MVAVAPADEGDDPLPQRLEAPLEGALLRRLLRLGLLLGRLLGGGAVGAHHHGFAPLLQPAEGVEQIAVRRLQRRLGLGIGAPCLFPQGFDFFHLIHGDPSFVVSLFYQSSMRESLKEDEKEIKRKLIKL